MNFKYVHNASYMDAVSKVLPEKYPPWPSTTSLEKLTTKMWYS